MKKIRIVLIVVITLSVLTGYSSFQTKNKVSAADTTVTIKPASDFTLKLPVSWKGCCVTRRSGKIKHGSYVAFYAKKCYQQTKEGWLFTIMRYKDDSYTDMPSYELVGKWNGFNYVALFPTDVQTMGAGKAAKKQYRKMNKLSLAAAASIEPVKKAKEGEGYFHASDFSLKLPDSWKNNYFVITSKEEEQYSDVTFYAKKCYEQTKEGCLFSIARYEDDSYREMPSYELVGKWGGLNYVALFPTDVQTEGTTKAAMKQYSMLNKSVEKVVRSISP